MVYEYACMVKVYRVFATRYRIFPIKTFKTCFAEMANPCGCTCVLIIPRSSWSSPIGTFKIPCFHLSWAKRFTLEHLLWERHPYSALKKEKVYLDQEKNYIYRVQETWYDQSALRPRRIGKTRTPSTSIPRCSSWPQSSARCNWMSSKTFRLSS